ncbi:MAG TPA: MFS transporter [Pseudorhodoplanes sp.]|jgi:MFS family permease|nr:MFS transporter [Pseudorhodoplanes sp.]
MSAAASCRESETRTAIRFLNWAHAIDHYVMLIFPTVVIGLEAVYGRPYAELIALGTASFVAFGVFSLPAGWLADRWSRRNMMALFFFGCGVSLAAAAVAPNLIVLAAALFLLGVFAAIYHPVGMAMLIEASQARGRTLAFNGVCGNLGAALAAGITAALASLIGWRGAFLVPSVLCAATGFFYLAMTPDDRHHVGKRKTAPAVRLSQAAMIAMFACFILVALTAGLVFNMISVSLPKIVDERLSGASLMLVGGVATMVFLCGALAQLSVGRLSERFTPHGLFAAIVVLQLGGIYWAAHASGLALIAALAVSMAAIYGQVTVNDMVIARYTADAWRGRVYAVRYFLIFVTSGAGVALIAILYRRGGFDLVLSFNALISVVLLFAVFGIVAIIATASPKNAAAAQPAE